MKIGVLPFLLPENGGVYQYSLAYLEALDNWKSAGAPHEFALIVERDASHPRVAQLAAGGWQIIQAPAIEASAARRATNNLRRSLANLPGFINYSVRRARRLPRDPRCVLPRPDWQNLVRSNAIDLMLYPMPVPYSFEAGGRYIMSIHDLQHRLQPEFPEVGEAREWHDREYIFGNGIERAAGILVDSPVGKEDVTNLYAERGARAEKVHIVPFVPAPYLSKQAVTPAAIADLRAKYDLPARYFFYPAQFWPHKNHARLIEALAQMRPHAPDVAVVLCGSHNGDVRAGVWAECELLIEKYHLSGAVRALGRVPDEAMAALYAGATALTMPTFFGPTNIPVLEAWALSCPVLTSDIRGIREQCGDAALLADPRSVEAISGAMLRLWNDGDLRVQLSARGRARLANYTTADFEQRLIAAIESAL